MGVVANVGADVWPRQGDYLGKRVVAYFDYDTARPFPGTIVREDMEFPGVAIIHLDDGRFVLTGECQYALAGRSNG